MLGLANPIQSYAWGAVDGLAPLVGAPQTGERQAELWIGAHPAAPSTTPAGDGARRTLADAVAADPTTLLGPDVVERYGARLPFLLKVLAIGGPLSIQLHPDPDQAAAGFAREEDAGIPIDAPERSFKDPFAKPEVLVALTPTWVLVGFRRGSDAAARLRSLGPEARPLADLVVDQPDARRALVHLLTADAAEREALAHLAATRAGAGDDARSWVRRLAAAYPGDATALAPLVLDLRQLHPGEGVFLPAGVPHAYLQGAGVELMAASDNVIRGGLTPKHVDTGTLVDLLAPPGVGVEPMPGDGVALGIRRYAPPVPDIALHRIEAGSRAMAVPTGSGPALAVATGGSAVLTTDDDRVELGEGRAVLVPPGERASCRVRGPGVVWWATTGADG
ncbi:MAG TPA: mannose-6-phosphate isomerase, class I [Iamia sp.]|nr:mannose-6-phosphate isomerase, class I [Iamia sp.]